MSPLRRILLFLIPYRRTVFLAFLATLLFTGLNLAGPLLMRFFINKVVEPKAWHLLLVTALAIVSAPILSAVVRFGNVWIIMYVGRRAIADLRMSIFRKVLRQDLQYHAEHSSGALVARLMDDVNRLQRLLTGDTVRIVVDILVFFFSLGFVFWVGAWLGWTLLGFIVLYILAYRFFSRRIKLATEAFRNLYDQIAGRLNETITGVRQVRIYNQEDRETSLFLGRTARSLDQELASRMNMVSLDTVCTAVTGYGSTVIASLGVYLVLVDPENMKYGDVFAVDHFVWMAIGPALRLTQIIGELTETAVSARRVTEILEAEPHVKSPPGAPRIERGAGAVEFRDVTFAYDPQVPLYEGLSLKVEPGMTVALVGATGCGKTTFTSLLMRHYDLIEGQILIDGVDISSVDLRSLRELFGVVLQDPVVFEGTLAENIAYGNPKATREQVEQAARSAEVYDLAVSMPDGFDTVLGTSGVKLSVGERQRLSIARAILKDPMILIMDEATSSLDSRSETLIQAALARVLQGRTSFVVAHRLSTITSADLIVVMDDGRIVEQGRHRDLLSISDGLYRRLYEELVGQDPGGAS
jgi:ATP-binding cassette, subfamily B, bacterial MsbA